MISVASYAIVILLTLILHWNDQKEFFHFPNFLTS